MNKFENVERFDSDISWYSEAYAEATMRRCCHGDYVSYEDYKKLLDACKALVEKQEEK